MQDSWDRERAAQARRGGFTLVELMIVVAIVAILAAVGYPSYTKHVLKSNRRAAQAQMMEIASREQQYLLANRSYASKTQLTASGYALPSQLTSLYDWDVSLAESSVPGFTVTFSARGAQTTDGNLTFTHDGVKAPLDKW
jgi:type IV pilus assembly protein PilE